MIFLYKELKNQGLDNYKINKKLENKELYKIEIGLYSDTEKYNQLEYVVKKYPNSIFTSESAFFYLGLTDYISSKYFLATKHNAKKIENDKIEQIFMANHFFETGKTEMNYNNVNINIYNKERMLIELVRNKNSIAFDYYKEIISNYREIADEIDIGVHKNLDIKQEEYMFNFEVFNNSMALLINTKEQIFVEKLSSMLKHGIRTTRYKDIYDFYYLITEGNMDKSLLIKLINIYCINNISRINTTSDIVNELSRIFNNPNFLENIQNSRYNWIGEIQILF